MAALADDGVISAGDLRKATKKLGIDSKKINPAHAGPAQKRAAAKKD